MPGHAMGLWESSTWVHGHVGIHSLVLTPAEESEKIICALQPSVGQEWYV